MGTEVSNFWFMKIQNFNFHFVCTQNENRNLCNYSTIWNFVGGHWSFTLLFLEVFSHKQYNMNVQKVRNQMFWILNRNIKTMQRYLYSYYYYSQDHDPLESTFTSEHIHLQKKSQKRTLSINILHQWSGVILFIFYTIIAIHWRT